MQDSFRNISALYSHTAFSIDLKDSPVSLDTFRFWETASIGLSVVYKTHEHSDFYQGFLELIYTETDWGGGVFVLKYLPSNVLDEVTFQSSSPASTTLFVKCISSTTYSETSDVELCFRE